jgi:chromosome segregation ATPase
MSQEEKDLATHVNLCHLRYEQLKGKLDEFETRLSKLEDEISAIKSDMQSGFSDIKLLLEKQSNSRTVQVIATFGTVAVSIITVIGYLLTK